ncbi:MAG: hypothetical protein AAF944_25735 [Bacteroidota bacterium]
MKKLTVYVMISMVLLVIVSCREQVEPPEPSHPSQCQAGRFTTESVPGTGVRSFTAEPYENVILHHWYINDTLVWSSDNRTFAYDFWAVSDGSVPGGAGDYDICLRVVTPNCHQGTKLFCEKITVESTS